MTREIRSVSDEDIRAADVLMLVDPGQPGWQRIMNLLGVRENEN